MALLWLVLLSSWVYEVSGHPIENYSVDTFLIAGYCKCAISFVKYMPQAYLNYKRKSTVGFAIGSVLLDLTGGLLSFFQLFLNAWALGEPLIGAGAFNFVKFLLSILSIFFDTIFLIQHYVLYADKWKYPQPAETQERMTETTG